MQSAFIGTDLEVRLNCRRCLLVVRQARPHRRLWPAEDVHQLTLALLSGEYATIAATDAILDGM